MAWCSLLARSGATRPMGPPGGEPRSAAVTTARPQRLPAGSNSKTESDCASPDPPSTQRDAPILAMMPSGINSERLACTHRILPYGVSRLVLVSAQAVGKHPVSLHRRHLIWAGSVRGRTLSFFPASRVCPSPQAHAHLRAKSLVRLSGGQALSPQHLLLQVTLGSRRSRLELREQ